MTTNDGTESEALSSPKRWSHWPILILSSLAAVANAIIPIVLVRILTPTEVGHFKIFFLYLIILPTFSFVSGIMSGIAYWSGQEDRRDSALQTSGMLVLFLSFVTALLTYLAHPLLMHYLDWPKIYANYFTVALFGTISSYFFVEAVIATGRVWTGAITHSAFEIIRTACFVTVALIYRDISAIFLTHAILMVCRAIFDYTYAYRLGLFRFTIDPDALKSVLRYAFPVSLAWIFGIFISHADQTILSFLISPDDFALYAIGCLSVPPLLIIEQSVTRVLVPQLAQALARSRLARAAVLFRVAVANLSFWLIPSVIGLIVFAEPIISLLFTDRYLGAAIFLQIFALGYLCEVVPYDVVARAKGNARWILRTFIAFSIVSIALAVTLTLKLGVIGALLSLLITKTLLRIYSLFYMKTVFKIRLGELLPLEELFRYTSVSVILGLLSVISSQLFSSQLLWFVFSGSLFAVLYFTALLFWKQTTVTCDKPHILLVTHSLEFGGLERIVEQLASSLHAYDRYRVTVFAFDHNSSTPDQSIVESLKAQGIELHVHRKGDGFSIATVFRLITLIHNQDVAIIHSHELGGLIYSALAKLLAFNQVAHVHTQHSFLHLEESSRYRYYEKVFGGLTDKITVVAPEIRETYIKLGVTAEKITFIPNGIAFTESPIEDVQSKIAVRKSLYEKLPAAESTKLMQHKHSTWLLNLARIHPSKAQSGTIDIWNALPPHVRSSSLLLFIGPESVKGEVERLKGSKILDGDRVIFLGSTKEPQRWMVASDLFISTSLFEGAPLTPIEAVAAGLPAVVSDIPGHAFLTDYVDTYPLEEAQIGATKVQALLEKRDTSSKTLANELNSSATKMRKMYSVDGMVARYLDVYKELLPSIQIAQDHLMQLEPKRV